MGFRILRRMRVLAVSLAALTATTTLFAIAGAAGPAAAATSSGCPATKTGLPVAGNVAAGFTTAGSTSTYTFASLTNENPSAGVPGLLKYCVYPTPTSQPKSTTVTAHGDNGAPWIVGTGSNNFAFVRPGGNPSNIGLDGKSHAMGTATWKTVPASQAIVLHINDPTECASLYGAGTSATCFVTPSPLPPPGPVCNAGDTTVAYNAMPTDVVNCLNPGVAFEANGWNEFGDEVGLATGTGRTLVSLKVDFQSFACQSGHWFSGDCSSAANATFDWPITANIYDPGNLTTPIASVTVTQTIPYRPSADNVNCTMADAGKWFNPLAPNGGACQNSIGTVLTFNFPATTIPDQVIWTVAFDTSTAGYNPVGTTSICTASGGCPYDSLNVGDKTYPPPAPYAGTSLFDTTNGGKAVGSKGPSPAPLALYPPDDNGRPLGEIITS